MAAADRPTPAGCSLRLPALAPVFPTFGTTEGRRCNYSRLSPRRPDLKAKNGRACVKTDGSVAKP